VAKRRKVSDRFDMQMYRVIEGDRGFRLVRGGKVALVDRADARSDLAGHDVAVVSERDTAPGERRGVILCRVRHDEGSCRACVAARVEAAVATLGPLSSSERNSADWHARQRAESGRPVDAAWLAEIVRLDRAANAAQAAYLSARVSEAKRLALRLDGDQMVVEGLRVAPDGAALYRAEGGDLVAVLVAREVRGSVSSADGRGLREGTWTDTARRPVTDADQALFAGTDAAVSEWRLATEPLKAQYDAARKAALAYRDV
jgi:hypothetical protein